VHRAAVSTVAEADIDIRVHCPTFYFKYYCVIVQSPHYILSIYIY